MEKLNLRTLLLNILMKKNEVLITAEEIDKLVSTKESRKKKIDTRVSTKESKKEDSYKKKIGNPPDVYDALLKRGQQYESFRDMTLEELALQTKYIRNMGTFRTGWAMLGTMKRDKGDFDKGETYVFILTETGGIFDDLSFVGYNLQGIRVGEIYGLQYIYDITVDDFNRAVKLCTSVSKIKQRELV